VPLHATKPKSETGEQKQTNLWKPMKGLKYRRDVVKGV